MRPVAADPTNPGLPPACSNDCRWRQVFNDYDLQRNSYRMEMASMVEEYRCGWNLKPGKIGGHPLDYATCIFKKR